MNEPETNNIEQQMIDNRVDRKLQHGPGMELQSQVQSRKDLEDTDASQKFYKKKGTSTLAGFNQLKMFRDGVDPQTREDGSYIVPNQYMLSGQKSLFGYDPVNGDKINDPTTSGPAWAIPLRVVAGGFHNMAQGTVGLGLDVAEAAGVDTGDARRNFESYQTPKWLTKSSGTAEDIATDVAQFGMGYAGAIKSLGAMGVKNLLGLNMGASIAGGQTFDPKEGNFGTLLNDFDMLPDFARYLDSKMTTEEYGTMAGRMSMVGEEIGLGLTFASVGKMFRTVKGRYQAHGDELVRKGVMQYNSATGSLNHPTLGSQGSEIMNTDSAGQALDMIATGMQIKGMKVNDFVEHAKRNGIDENLAKKAWNNAAKDKLQTMQQFLSPPSPGPLARQKGNVSLFEGGTVTDAAKVADFESVDKYFKKQISRGNMQRAEYDDIIKPTMDEMKNRGTGKGSPKQVLQYAQAKRPQYKTITKIDDSRFATYTYSPNKEKAEIIDSSRMGEKVPEYSLLQPSNIDLKDNISADYKEHLFIARNELRKEGPDGYVHKVHFTEPHVRGIARTNLMAKGTESMLGEPRKIVHNLLTDAKAKYDNVDWDEIDDYEFDTFVAEKILKDPEKVENYINKIENGGELTSQEKFVANMANDIGEVFDIDINVEYFTNSVMEDPKLTRLLESIAPRSRIIDGKIYVQELQSDAANAARKYGEWTDEKLLEFGDEIYDVATNGSVGGYIETVTNKLLSPAKAKSYLNKRQLKEKGEYPDFNDDEQGFNEFIKESVKKIASSKDSGEFTKTFLRKNFAYPSAFNEDKAWVRQAIAPVVEDARKKGVDIVVLASERVIDQRWDGHGPGKMYQSDYPRILAQYFRDLGVPNKDIHMPSKGGDKVIDHKSRYVSSSDSFWVKLPKKVMDGTQKLPQYSVAGSAPMTMKFGEEDEK